MADGLDPHWIGRDVSVRCEKEKRRTTPLFESRPFALALEHRLVPSLNLSSGLFAFHYDCP